MRCPKRDLFLSEFFESIKKRGVFPHYKKDNSNIGYPKRNIKNTCMIRLMGV